ncbi:hypothetical protein LWI29_029664 [Acer saccharum]|uniref:Uncharacterized protein n=1 Tax=Acer saccharum TaxID=4024 RepID=A0AA39W2S1_ACESA|nr:hypothetical protein LWI29_029664 [Acer saccharum]
MTPPGIYVYLNNNYYLRRTPRSRSLLKMSVQLRYLMRRVASKRELVRNPTSFIRGQPMHTDTVAGHANLSSRSKVIVALYIGTNSVGVSYFGRDPVFSQGVKSFWPPLNRTYQDAFSIATDIKKIKEEHGLCWLVVGRPWFSQRARAALNRVNQFAKEQMEEHVIVAHVMSSSIEEGEADNDLNDGAAKVDSFFEDLMSTGILTGIEIIYYNAKCYIQSVEGEKNGRAIDD